MRATSLGRMLHLVGLCALSVPLVPGTAVADEPVPGPPGAVCSLATAAIWRDSRYEAVVNAGPLAGDGTLRCTVQIYDATAQPSGSTHAGPDTVSVAAAGETVVALAGRPVSWTEPAGSTSYLCTEFQVAGGPLLFWHHDGRHWTTEAHALCAPLSHGVAGVVLPGEGPIVSPDPAEPYYPTGVVEISSLGPGAGVAFRLFGFDPPVAQWSCTYGQIWVDCVPPPRPGNGYNVCATVTVQVTTPGVSPVEGSTGCAYGRVARATAGAPSSATAHAAAPHAAFAWRCAASPGLLAVQWSVRCTVAA